MLSMRNWANRRLTESDSSPDTDHKTPQGTLEEYALRNSSCPVSLKNNSDLLLWIHVHLKNLSVLKVYAIGTNYYVALNLSEGRVILQRRRPLHTPTSQMLSALPYPVVDLLKEKEVLWPCPGLALALPWPCPGLALALPWPWDFQKPLIHFELKSIDSLSVSVNWASEVCSELVEERGLFILAMGPLVESPSVRLSGTLSVEVEGGAIEVGEGRWLKSSLKSAVEAQLWSVRRGKKWCSRGTAVGVNGSAGNPGLRCEL
ncbi:Protein of unknown function [Gryllus bimaculatus]|nr:Protein of unknown function [Gryllus bimaculatus]